MLISVARKTRATLTHEALAQVQAKLDAAVESFVRMRLNEGPNGRDALLREAAALLEDVFWRWQRERPPSKLPAAELRKTQMLWLLRGIQARAGQLQALNDTAVGLCRGWLSAPPPALDDYTPEGVWASVHEPGGLRISA